MGWVEDLHAGIVGPESQRPDGAADWLAGTFKNPDRLYNQSLSMAALFSPAGDGIDAVAALTGKDPFSGRDLAGWERWLSAIGLTVGVGALGMGAMTAMGQHPSMLLSAGRARPADGRLLNKFNFDELDMSITRMADMADEGTGVPGRLPAPPGFQPARRIVANVVPEAAYDDDLLRLSTPNSGLEDPERLFMTTSEFTNRTLQINTADDVDGPMGFEKLGRDIVQDVDGNIDVDAAYAAEAFALTLGNKLVENIPSFQKRAFDKTLNHTGGNQQLETAAWTVAQWQYAVNAHPEVFLQFRFAGKRAQNAMKEWNALKAGESFDLEELTDVLVDFAKVTNHIGHPELFVNPLVALRHVNLDVVGKPQFAHTVLDFPYQPVNFITEMELSARINAMAQMHPAGITGLAADNIRQIADLALNTDSWDDVADFRKLEDGFPYGPTQIGADIALADNPQEAVRIWRRWYQDVRAEMQTKASELRKEMVDAGIDPTTINPHWRDDDSFRRWLTTAAAVLSAAEQWETNVQKAVDIARAMVKYRGASIEDLHSALTKGGMRASHGYLNAPATNPQAKQVAEFLMESFHQDDVRNFMDTRKNYDPVTSLRQGVERRARENVEMGRDSNLFEGEYRPLFDSFGSQERQIRQETKRIYKELGLEVLGEAPGDPRGDFDARTMYEMLAQARQHVYYMNQQEMIRDGLPEIVTLYRGDSNVGGLPEEFLGSAMMGTSTQFSDAQGFAMRSAGHGVPGPDIARRTFKYEVPREEIIIHSGARMRRKAHGGEVEQNLPADVLRRYVVAAQGPELVADRPRLEELGVRFDAEGRVEVPAQDVYVGTPLTLNQDELIKVLLIAGADDPLDAFRVGTAGPDGLTLAQVGKMLNEGSITYKQALEMRAAPAKYGSLKTDSFAYGIEAQLEADRLERAEFVAQMLEGNLGYKFALGEAQPGENLNRMLPVVFDRQAYKVAVGFSMNPESWINNRSGYNPFAHAYRMVAAEMGVVDGMPVLPEELQAITWMKYRAMAHVTDPMGNPWPNKYSKKNDLLGQTMGFRRDAMGSTGMTEGHGPDFMFSNSFLKFATGQFTQNLPSPRLATQGAELANYSVMPSTLKPIRKSKVSTNRHEMVYEIDPDTGQAVLLTDPGATPRRNMVQSMATVNDAHVMMPRGPRRVFDVDAEVKLIQDTTRDINNPNQSGLIGYQKHNSPENLPGDMDRPVMYVGSMMADGPEIPILEQSRFTRFGGTAHGSHDRMAALFTKHNLEFEVIDMAPHQGRSFVWHDPESDLPPVWREDAAREQFGDNFNDFRIEHSENRQARLFVFNNHGDLSRARAIANSDATTDYVPARAAEEFMAEYMPGRPWNAPNPAFYDSPASQERIIARAPEAAAAYNDMPSEPSQAVLNLYEEFYAHVKRQFLWMEKQGIIVEVRDIDFDNPRDVQDYYASTAEFVRDVTENNRLIVSKTPAEGNPEIYLRIDPDTGLSNNDMFRAVHDYFGHVVHENGVDRFGEDIAFMTHAQMFPEEVLPVLTQETRMQNWWLVANNEPGAANPIFPEQKLGLAPREFWEDAVEFAEGRGQYTQQKIRNKDLIYKDEVTEFVYYYNTDTDAPTDLIPVYEHKAVDAAGGTMVTFSPSGDLNNSATNRAYLDAGSHDLGDYATGAMSGRFEPGGVGTHVLTGDPTTGTLTFDNKVVVRVLADQEFGVFKSGPRKGKFKGEKGPFDVVLDGGSAKEMAMYIPPRGSRDLPVIAYGEEGIAALRSDFGPERVVFVRDGMTGTEIKSKTTKKEVRRQAYIVELPLPSGKSRRVDGDLFTLANEYLSEISSVPGGGRRIVPVEVAGGRRVMERY